MVTAEKILTLECSARLTLELVANKWSLLVIYALGYEKRRYTEIKRLIQDVTHKMLTQTLRQLEQDGLVERTVHPVVPPCVEYALTPLGVSLGEALIVFCEWGERHYAEVESARLRQIEVTE